MTASPSPADVLRTLEPGAGLVTVARIIPTGSLQARKTRDGVVNLFWRYAVTVGGKTTQVREPIGRFDASLPPKSLKPTGDRYSLAAAIRRAEELAQQHEATRDEGGLLATREAERLARAEAELTALTDKAMTLSLLMHDYAQWQQDSGKDSHRDVRSLIRCHIDPRPVAHTTARLMTPEAVNDMIRAIANKGTLRTANKVRSYIGAAYELAKRSRLDSNVPARFKQFNITTNPAGETYVVKARKVANGKPVRAKPAALTVEQFRAYWAVVRDVEGYRGALLRFHLLTGGQRLDQLVRLSPANIDADRVTIYDIKGRGDEAREHVIPLIPEAAKALRECAATDGEWAFTSDGGATHINGETLSGWSLDAVADAPKELRDVLAGFKPKHIRSGVESVLDDAGVPKDDRYALQSHGLSGAIHRAYNAAEGVAKKRAALQLFFQLLTARRTPSKVVPLAARKG